MCNIIYGNWAARLFQLSGVCNETMFLWLKFCSSLSPHGNTQTIIRDDVEYGVKLQVQLGQESMEGTVTFLLKYSFF
jgi:hypothetical protein